MKKSVKLILILAIVAVLLFAAGAYILFFRSNVTAGFYVSRGDAALERGACQQAVDAYTAALRLSPDDPTIPLSLAEAYKGVGNYTKAEYTLVSAITRHPENTDLYVALSHTYVEQGKFLDADQMLSRAANETVKAELAAMRPEPPTLTPESGYYSTYITVSAVCSAGRIYWTSDGSYPSRDEDLYTEPLELPLGQTTLCALVVDDSGLVSPAVYAGYTVAGVIEPVTLTDPALDSAARAVLEKAPEDPLITSELWGIPELELSGAADLSQLSQFTGLTTLKISNTSVSDFSALRSLTKLQSLDLSGCVVPLAGLEAIGSLPELTKLDLAGCAVSNADPLSPLAKLQTLDLSNNSVSDLSALGKMTSLEVLSLHNNPVSNVAPLANCTQLRELDLSSGELVDVAPLGKLADLEKLNLSDNDVETIAALSGCAALTTLDVSSNWLTDASVLAELPELAVFDGSHNNIAAIPKFDASAKLQSLTMNYNLVTDVSGLSGLGALNYVRLDYNNVTDLSPLASCYNLVQVDAWGDPVSQSSVEALQSHSIIVNYNPNA